LFRSNVNLSDGVEVIIIRIHLLIPNLENLIISETVCTVWLVFHGVVQIAHGVGFVPIVELIKVFLVERGIQVAWNTCTDFGIRLLNDTNLGMCGVFIFFNLLAE
jgi:hypothetical protein